MTSSNKCHCGMRDFNIEFICLERRGKNETPVALRRSIYRNHKKIVRSKVRRNRSAHCRKQTHMMMTCRMPTKDERSNSLTSHSSIARLSLNILFYSWSNQSVVRINAEAIPKFYVRGTWWPVVINNIDGWWAKMETWCHVTVEPQWQLSNRRHESIAGIVMEREESFHSLIRERCVIERRDEEEYTVPVRRK